MAVHARRGGRIEFNLQQIARIQQDSGVQHHAAFAHFGAAAFDHGGREALGGHHANGHVDGKAIPAARVFGNRHPTHHHPCNCFHQITKVK